jgi:uncharacterized membrane protein
LNDALVAGLMAGVVLLLALLVLSLVAILRVRKPERQTGLGPGGELRFRLLLLEQRLARIERRLGGPAEGAAAREGQSALEPGAAAAPRPGRARDLEALIAGRWLNYVGVLALLFAVSFFLKFAFENNWVGPGARVAIGLLFGAGLLAYSRRLLEREHRYFSEGIAGLGVAVLDLSVYAGHAYYHLFGRPLAFAGMSCVTAVTVALAGARNSQRIALLALVGGFLTPLLLTTGIDQQAALFSYLILLDAALLALAGFRNWRSLELVSLAFTLGFFWAWYADFYQPSKLAATAAFAGAFFVLFAALPVIRSRREEQLRGVQIALVLVNAVAFLGALDCLLWPDDRWALALALLALSGLHLVAWRAIPSVPATFSTRLVYAGLALTFATLVIPVRLEGRWITIAWAIEGAVLVWAGVRARKAGLRGAGLLLFAVVTARLLVLPIPAPRLLWNARFAAFAAAAACFVLALWLRRSADEGSGEWERAALAALAVAVNVLAVVALSLEIWDFVGRPAAGAAAAPNLARRMALSLLWIGYASVLMALGVRRRAALLRWQGLALFGLAAGKVFFYDLSFLERAYRILSFLVLGIVLLIVSFLYQRRPVPGR